MNIAITGGTGFIGKHLVESLVSKNHQIFVLGRDYAKLERSFRQHKKIEIIKTDFTYENLKLALKNIDVVIHLAARRLKRDTDPFKLNEFWQANIENTQNLLKASVDNGIKRFCLTSTISVYSVKNEVPLKECEPAIPANIYGVSKLISEKLVQYFSNFHNFDFSILRLGRVFGNGEIESLVFGKFFNQAKKKQTLNVWGKGSFSVDYIYVKDVISAIEKSIDTKSPSGIFNIGSGKTYSIKTIAESLNSYFMNEGNINFDTTKNENKNNIYMDIAKVRKELDWKPMWNLLDAINDMDNL